MKWDRGGKLRRRSVNPAAKLRWMVDLNSLSLPDLFQAVCVEGLERLLGSAREEDFGAAGDITSASIVSQGQTTSASVVARAAGVLAGMEILPGIASVFGPFEVKGCAFDGETVEAGDLIATIHGEKRLVLGAERTLLNLLGRLSGIATLTRRYVDEVSGTKAVICDTRKTTPGLRGLEKYAVRCGGGTLHRIGLFDAALYKDNHLAGIELDQLGTRLTEAIRKVRNRDVRFVEVEVDTLHQLREILEMERGLVDMVLLDNMSPGDLRKAVGIRDAMADGVLLEASGGVNLTTVRGIAETGVDRISIGAITHSAGWLDIGLDFA